MKLYSMPHSPFAARVRIQIYHKKLPVEIAAPPGFGEPGYKELNPTGKVPALDTGEMIIPESTVILRYLEESYPEPAMLPVDVTRRATVNLFLRFADVYIQPALRPLFTEVFERSGDEAALAAKVQEVTDALTLQNQMMNRYAWGEHAFLDLADCALAPMLYYCIWLEKLFSANLRLDELEAVEDWWRRVQQREAVASVFKEIDNGLLGMQERLADNGG